MDKENIPEHVAIIMDGNGRWAKSLGLERWEGHKKGVDAVRTTMEAAGEIGVKYLTLYAFSIENWKRPKKEIDVLMGLMVDAILAETDNLMRKQVRVKAIGNLSDLPEEVYNKLQGLITRTVNSSVGIKLWSKMGDFDCGQANSSRCAGWQNRRC